MITIIALILSLCLNIRLAYCLGKHYKYTKKCCQGGSKHLYEKVEEDHKEISLKDEKNISTTNKDE
jgi:hypothetical protein